MARLRTRKAWPDAVCSVIAAVGVRWPRSRLATHSARRHIGRDVAAFDRPGDDRFEGLALQRPQRGIGEFGVKFVAGNETVPGVEKGEGVGRHPDRFFQPGELQARLGHVVPEQDDIAVLVAAGLDLDHPPVCQGEIQRCPGIFGQLRQAHCDKGVGAAGQAFGRDLRQFQPDDLLIAFADQAFMQRQLAEDMIEMGAGVNQAGLRIINGDDDAQAIKRAQQPDGVGVQRDVAQILCAGALQGRLLPDV